MARALTTLALVAWSMPALLAQTAQPDAGRQPQPFTYSLTGDLLTDLPSGSTIFSLLDTAFAELISDRIDAGSLTVGQAPRMGAHGSSWTQTTLPSRRRGYFESGRERHSVRPAGSAWMGADGHRDRRAAGRLELARAGRDPGAKPAGGRLDPIDSSSLARPRACYPGQRPQPPRR